MKMTIGHDDNKFEYEFTEKQYKNMNTIFARSPDALIYENTKCSIEYQLNIFYNNNIDITVEYFKNINDCMLRMYNLKQIGIITCNIFIVVYDGRKRTIIDDCFKTDLYDLIIKENESKFVELYEENEVLKIENKIYKDFIEKNHAEKNFEEYKRSIEK